MSLRSLEFRNRREPQWRELERLVDRVESKGIRSLSAQQLSRLPILYRAAASSLSVARAISLDANVSDYLEALVARAYFCVYGTRRHFREAAGEFFAVRFPAAVRALRGPVLLAAAILLLGGAAGFLLTLDDPERFYAFVDPAMAQGRDPTATTESLREVLYDEREAGEGLAGFAGFLFSHNARIGFLAFVLGIALGVPVFLLLLSNGLLLGAFAALHHARGLSADLWGWILPHGITELSAVVLCGGAGLVLARAILLPGRHTRLENLGIEGREAGVLAIGACAMFFVAAVIEGIFRQTVQSIVARYALAAATLLLWGLYFGRAGKGRG